MRTKFKTFLTAIFSIAYTFTLHGQNSINSSGNEASGSGGKISYSIGQICYSVNSSSSGLVTQGVQQPYEISVVTELKNSTDIKCSAFPNPVTTYLQIEISNYSKKKMDYLLYDNAGKLLKIGKIENRITILEMNNYNNSDFLLKITDNNNILKTFKIIKK